jgi:hypothetical protein
LEFPLFPPSLHNTCSCYYLHSQIDADKDSDFWLVNLHPSSIQVERKIGCISIPSIKCMLIFGVKLPIRYPFHEIWVSLKPGIHDTSFASKSPFKFLEFKFFGFWLLIGQSPSKLKDK